MIEKGHCLRLIATCKPATESKRDINDFATLAKENNAIFLDDIHLENHIQSIKKAHADIGLSMNWVSILNSAVISEFSLGIINAHPGNLPQYRGNACPNWAILNGEQECGITIHQMMPSELDAGDIILQKSILLKPSTTIGEIYKAFEEMIPQMLTQAAESLFDGSATLLPQPKDPKDVLRVFPRLPQDGYIDWNASAENIIRLIKASGYPFSGAYTYFNNDKLIIWDAEYLPYTFPSCSVGGHITYRDDDNGYVAVAAKNGQVLIKEISYQNLFHVPPTKIIHSMRTRLGINPADKVIELEHRLLELEKRLT